MNNLKLEKSKFKRTMEQRLYEISKFWAAAENEYESIDDFTSSLNALIQSLRNLTFILQSNKNLIDDFDEWYLQKQNKMKTDKNLAWLRDARNVIVKQDNLKLKSKTTVDLYNWEKHPVLEILVDPFDNTETIKKSILASVEHKEIVSLLRDPILRIERCWISDNLPEKELLSLTAYCYQELKKIIIEVFEKMNFNLSKLNYDLEKDSQILNNITTFENNRSVVFDMKSMKKLTVKSKEFKMQDKDEKIVEERYGKPEKIKEESGLRGLFEFSFNTSKKVLKRDGYHQPVIFFYLKSGKTQIYFFPMADRAQLYLFIRKFADDIIKNKEVMGAVLIFEMWIKTLQFKVEGESLLVAMLSKEDSEIRMTSFKRTKIIQFEETHTIEKSEMPALKPIIDALDER